MLLESTVCWFPGLSEAAIKGMREIIKIILTDYQRGSAQIGNTAAFKRQALWKQGLQVLLQPNLNIRQEHFLQ